MIKVAITQRLISVGEHAELRDSLSLDWSYWLHTQGALTIPVPNLGPAVVNSLVGFAPDLIIFTNGENLPLDENGGLDWTTKNQRDVTELAMYQWANENDVPVLGICRGCQLLNLLSGGKIKEVSGHVAQNHQVRCDFPFYQGKREVNSYHHFGLQPDLTEVQPIAVTESGQIEAFRHKNKKLVGMMWHPEREHFSHQFSDDFHQKLIRWVVKL